MTEGRKPATDLKGLLPVLCNGIWLVLTVSVILVCLPFAVPELLGVRTYVIASGSMEPELPTGSLVYVETVALEELESGEIITFYAGVQEEGIVTHRIVENRKEEKELLTKGDANEAADPIPVSYGQVIGRVKGHVPCLGWMYPVMSGSAGKVRLLALLLAAMLFRVVGRRIAKNSTFDVE